MLCIQKGQNMNLFKGWRVFYGLDGKVTKLTDFELQSFEVTGYAN